MRKPAEDPRLGRLHALTWMENRVSPSGRCVVPCKLGSTSTICCLCGKGSEDKWRKTIFDNEGY